MSRTIVLLDRVTGVKERRLLIDAKEAVANDPARYALVGAAEKSRVKAVAELAGNGPHALRVGRLKFEPK